MIFQPKFVEGSNPKSIWHLVHENVVGGNSMIRFRLVIAVSERDMPGIEPGPLGWHTSALTNELQEVSCCLQTWEVSVSDMVVPNMGTRVAQSLFGLVTNLKLAARCYAYIKRRKTHCHKIVN